MKNVLLHSAFRCITSLSSPPVSILKKSLSTMSNLYVGNLAYAVSNEDLKRLFEEFGTIHSAKVIIDRDTKRSKGFGFVELKTMKRPKQPSTSWMELNLKDCTLKVNIARPREEKTFRQKKVNSSLQSFFYTLLYTPGSHSN
ncbi:MAG: RNA-binding protein [Balneolaceae bacterium]|nr:RNA-binding protein [Balneolaceae bacterium]